MSKNTVETIQDRIHKKAENEAMRLLREMRVRWEKDLISLADYASNVSAAAYATDISKSVVVRLDSVINGLEKSLLQRATEKLENQFTEEFFRNLDAMDEKFAEIQQYTREQ